MGFAEMYSLLRRVLSPRGIWFFPLAAWAVCLFTIPGCSSKPAGPVVGQEAPNFIYQRLGGSQQELRQLRGKVVMVRFWADWCSYCVREMPVIEEYFRSAGKKGFVPLGINVKQSRAQVEAFAREMKLSFPIGFDEDGTIAKGYDVKGIPSHFLIDREGILRKVYFGPIVDGNLLARFLEPYL